MFNIQLTEGAGYYNEQTHFSIQLAEGARYYNGHKILRLQLADNAGYYNTYSSNNHKCSSSNSSSSSNSNNSNTNSSRAQSDINWKATLVTLDCDAAQAKHMPGQTSLWLGRL